MPDIPNDKTLTQGPMPVPSGAIGPYRLIQMLGEGGMGEVWRADQVRPFQRTVALKLIKAGMDTKDVVARFDSERQALAVMEHPNIAKVFDAGATPAGRPYFVMEYVPGLAITDYCDQHRLSIKERLGLFMQVCEGVQHAHQKAIIHRDLKPSNILVEELDHKAVPKIIDFGLAKAMGQRLTQLTMYTEIGAMMGTPGYMSPEQADRNERSIDTRTDVYSLGVILYELLVGTLPFAQEDLRDAGLEATLRKIREQEPSRPSTKTRSLGESAKVLAAKRREQPESLARHLRGDLDWIAMKALEKDRTRRYGSASDLAADIQRYLDNRPVLAGPPSATYRAAKFIRRHRFGVAVTAAGMVLLLAFTAAMALQASRIAKERDRANREAEASKRVVEFMTNMFKVSSPSEARGNTVTAREILDKASSDIDTGLAKDPELQARLLDVMGNVYYGLGLFPRAESLLTRAVDIHRRVLAPENPASLASMDDLARVLWEQGRYPESEKLLGEVLDTRRRILGPNQPDTLSSTSNLGNLRRLEGRIPEAEKLFREVLEKHRREKPYDPLTLNAMNSLALTLSDQGRNNEAEKLHRETLDGWRRLYGVEHPSTLMSMSNLAIVLRYEGRYREAEQLNRQTIEIKNRVLGPEHPNTLMTRNNLALVLRDEGRYLEAEEQESENLEVTRRVFGPQHPQTFRMMNNLADLLTKLGQYSRAEKLQLEVLEFRRRVLGPQHPDTLLAAELLGITYSYEKQYARTESLFHEAVQGAEQSSDKSVLALAWYNFACGAAVAGRREKALEYLRKADVLGSQNIRTMATDDDLKSLRNDARFVALITKAKQRAAAAHTSN